jgi:polysaccharide biosynthesis transport protein
MRQMEVAADAQTSNISVVDRAEVPNKPASPKKLLSIVVALLLSASGGIGAAFLMDYLDDTLKDPEEVERFLRLPNLGVVPDFQSLETAPPTRAHLANDRSFARIEEREQRSEAKALILSPSKAMITGARPLTAASEAYKIIRTGLTLAQAGQHPRSIAFTSGTAGEGKTVTAINSAIAFSQTGSRVLLIDADLRHPNCHDIFGVENSSGLTEVLAGQSDLADVIRPTAVGGLSLVTAGSTPPNPAELLGSPQMKNLLDKLTQLYDYVLFDTAPIMPIIDSVVLSKLMDGVVIVVGPGTPRPLVLNACRRLRRIGCKIFGVVLNGVNVHNVYFQRHGYHPNTYYSHWRHHQQSA